MSKGAFSYTAGVLNDGITLYDPQKYRALQDWIVRAPDGSFERGARRARACAALLRNTLTKLCDWPGEHHRTTDTTKNRPSVSPGGFRMNIERGDDDF